MAYMPLWGLHRPRLLHETLRLAWLRRQERERRRRRRLRGASGVGEEAERPQGWGGKAARRCEGGGRESRGHQPGSAWLK